MKHIKNLILKNFQQWKSGTITFSEGLNVIIGNTESGKSTLFRAINSILTGKMPEDYIRKGTKDCEVKIEFSDGSTFRRIRGKNNIADANGTIFERVGKEIPFEYFKQLGKTNIEFGNKQINLCNYSQFEPHFFITLSDYDKSKLIGTICGIDIVDKIVDSINKDIRDNNSTIKFLEAQIYNNTQDKESKQKQYDLLAFKTKNLEKYLKTAQDKFKTLTELSDLHQKMKDLNNNITLLKDEKNNLRVNSNIDCSKMLLLKKIFNCKNILENFNNDINILINEKKTLKTEANFRTNDLYKLVFAKNKLNEYNIQIEKYNNNKLQIKEDLNKLIQQKKELLKGYDKCPLCGGIL